MSDKVILDLLREVRDEQKEHTIFLTEMRKDIERNTDDLERHIEGVVQNRKRIAKLEEPFELVAKLRKAIIWIGGLLGTSYGIYELILRIKS